MMSIGEFARLSRLSPKALRLYDELGLLPPARVDPGSGYRWYAAGQLDNARLVASLRQIGVPLAQITVILGLPPEAAAQQVGAYWSGTEADHAARRDLAGYLADRLTGKRNAPARDPPDYHRASDRRQQARGHRLRLPAARPGRRRLKTRGVIYAAGTVSGTGLISVRFSGKQTTRSCH
jgi:DNA-binding transcriptional MerR regulator